MSDLDRQISNWGTINIGPNKNHIKINIEQSAKGARVTVTLDREDHEIDKAIDQAVNAYIGTIDKLKELDLRVDEYENV